MGNYVQEIRGGAGKIPIYRQPNFLAAAECKGGMPSFHVLGIAHRQFARENKMVRHLRDEALKKASDFAYKDCPGWKRQGWREKIR